MVHGVVCYWDYVAPPLEYDHNHCHWRFVEAYPIDRDGYPLVAVQNTGQINSRQEWDNWLYIVHKPENGDEDDYEYEPVLGRAVTIWTMADGARLLKLNPP